MAKKPAQRRRSTGGPDELRARLQREREQAVERLQQMRESPEHQQDSLPQGNEGTADEGDAAQASERRDMTFATRERLANRINRITAALERIARGTYGRCVECGGDIEAERLAAIPEAATCLACQQRREQHRVPKEAA